MRLAEYTDYTLRVLMYCAAHQDRLVTIAEIAGSHAVSKNHLMKIVNDLSRQGLVATTRGRGGGLRLVKHPSQIRIGDVIRFAETDFRLVECFDAATNACVLSPTCRLRGLLDRAMQAWLREVDSATLQDMVPPTPVAAPGGSGRVKPIAVRVTATPAAPVKRLASSRGRAAGR